MLRRHPRLFFPLRVLFHFSLHFSFAAMRIGDEPIGAEAISPCRL